MGRSHNWLHNAIELAMSANSEREVEVYQVARLARSD